MNRIFQYMLNINCDIWNGTMASLLTQLRRMPAVCISASEYAGNWSIANERSGQNSTSNKRLLRTFSHLLVFLNFKEKFLC